MTGLQVWGRPRSRGQFGAWHPFASDFGRFFSEMDRALEGSLSNAGGQFGEVYLSCDVRETEKEFRLEIEVPGVTADDLQIETEGNVLSVSGERKSLTEEGDSSHLLERRYGRFKRSFALPDTADLGKVSASYSDGVLVVTVPKAEAAKPKRIPIQTQETGFFKKISGKAKDKQQAAVY